MDQKHVADDCPLAVALATRLRDARNELTGQWLARIASRVSIDANRVFPTDELLDHVPLLMDGIAAYVENPGNELAGDIPVVGKARELGALRHAQGFDAYEILKEYEILGGILFTFFARAVETITEPCEKQDLMQCASRLFRAVTIIQQATMTHFMQLADTQVAEREARLRAFNRVVSHEIKNRIGAIMGAGATLLEIQALPPENRDKMLEVIVRNAREMQSSVENILVVSRMEKDVRRHRHVRLPQAVKEAVRQLRERAQAAQVDVRVSASLPDIEVNAAVVELAVTNYLSNAIKYANRARSDRAVDIDAAIEERHEVGRELIVRVRDNGLGVPAEKRERLFERFFRAHESVREVEGTGLGLSIVREIVESQGGRAWAEHGATEAQGCVFAIALPLRREGAASTDRRGDADASEAPVFGQLDAPLSQVLRE
jgi:signal transduction histidine kinase